MNKKLIALISVLAAVVLLANGCGGAGGTGRYTIPSDIGGAPFGPGGPLGPGGPGVPGGPGGPGVPAGPAETDPEALLAAGWEDFNYGAYSSAIGRFNQIINLSGVSESQKINAYNGLGWAQAKSTGAESSYASFVVAAPSNNEAAVGLAAVLMHRSDAAGIKQAVNLLEGIGLGNTAYRFQSAHSVGVSSAEAHAMLAFCYFCRNQPGDNTKATAQISTARAEDASSDGTVYQIYSTLQSLGLPGI